MSAANNPRARPKGYLYYRHTLPVRIMHWINVVALTVLFMSGLNIFNAHPALYLGEESGFEYDNAVLALAAEETNSR